MLTSARAAMKNVLVVESFHPDGLAMLTSRKDIRVRVTEDRSPAALAEAVVDADIIAVRNTPMPKELLEKAAHLACVAKHGVGVDKLDMAYLTQRGVPVLNTPGANAVSVAEHTLTLILAVAKKLLVNDAAVRNGNFAIRETRNTTCISGKKILICGFGNIGKAVARLLASFGMDLYFYDPFFPADADDLHATRVADLHAALPAMDIVSLHMPLTDATKNLIDAKALSLMRPEAILVSAARGGVVNESDLYEALKAGRIAGAGLDVFEQEPPLASNPLLTLDSVVTSPHNAALSREGARQMGMAMSQNIIDFLENNVNPANIVNKAVFVKA